MYNFNLEKGENLHSIYDDVTIRQGDNQRVVSIAITNKRILFLDYQSVEPYETLKGAHASDYIKIKEIIFYRLLTDIKKVSNRNGYSLEFNDGYEIEFDNTDLYNCLNK